MHRNTPLVRVALVTALALGPAFGCATGSAPDAAAPVASSPPSRLGGPKDAVARTPELTDAQKRARMHYQMGIDNLRGNRAPQAIGELLTAERFDPRDAEIQFALAEAYRQQGRQVETEAHLARALQINPNFHQARFNLAAIYIQAERTEEAVTMLNQLLADPTFPSPWRALTNLGWAEFRLGRLDAAHQHLTMAVDYRPDYWPARLNLAILEAEQGNRDQAIEHFQRVLEGKPSASAEAEVRYRLAEQLVSRGDKMGAVRQLNVASGLPSGPWSKRSAEYLKTLE
jgi:type IV pilus biogenesis/stability protein PilW